MALKNEWKAESKNTLKMVWKKLWKGPAKPVYNYKMIQLRH